MLPLRRTDGLAKVMSIGIRTDIFGLNWKKSKKRKREIRVMATAKSKLGAGVIISIITLSFTIIGILVSGGICMGNVTTKVTSCSKIADEANKRSQENKNFIQRMDGKLDIIIENQRGNR